MGGLSDSCLTDSTERTTVRGIELWPDITWHIAGVATIQRKHSVTSERRQVRKGSDGTNVWWITVFELFTAGSLTKLAISQFVDRQIMVNER